MLTCHDSEYCLVIMVWQMHFQRLYERGHGGEQQDAAADDRAMGLAFGRLVLSVSTYQVSTYIFNEYS